MLTTLLKALWPRFVLVVLLECASAQAAMLTYVFDDPYDTNYDGLITANFYGQKGVLAVRTANIGYDGWPDHKNTKYNLAMSWDML